MDSSCTSSLYFGQFKLESKTNSESLIEGYLRTSRNYLPYKTSRTKNQKKNHIIVTIDGDTFLYTLCISKIAQKNSSQKFWSVIWKSVHLQPNSRKSIKIAAMQRLKFNILGGLNIQSLLCLECCSCMHTSGIAALCYSHRKTFHIARGGSGLLLT